MLPPERKSQTKDAERLRAKRAEYRAQGLTTKGTPPVTERKGAKQVFQPSEAMRALIRTLKANDASFSYMVSELEALREKGELVWSGKIGKQFIQQNFQRELAAGSEGILMACQSAIYRLAVGGHADQVVRVLDPVTKKTVEEVRKVEVRPDFRSAAYLSSVHGGSRYRPSDTWGAKRSENQIEEEKLPPIPSSIEIVGIVSPRKDQVS